MGLRRGFLLRRTEGQLSAPAPLADEHLSAAHRGPFPVTISSAMLLQSSGKGSTGTTSSLSYQQLTAPLPSTVPLAREHVLSSGPLPTPSGKGARHHQAQSPSGPLSPHLSSSHSSTASSFADQVSPSQSNPSPPAPEVPGIVRLREKGSDVVHFFHLAEPQGDGRGRLDWVGVEKVFGVYQSGAVSLQRLGTPPLYYHGDLSGLTRVLFSPDTEEIVIVHRKGGEATESASNLVSQLEAVLASQRRLEASMTRIGMSLPILAAPLLRQLAASPLPSDARDVLDKEAIISFYDASKPGEPHRVRCSATGRYLDKSYVTGAHILPVSAEEHMGHLGFSDINDLRNTVVWCQPIEKAWHKYAIGFDADYRLHIFDESIRAVTLNDYVEEIPDKGARFRQSNLGDTTFNDIEGQVMRFNNDRRPMKRCFLFMASAAMAFQRQRGNLSLRLNFKGGPHSPYAEAPILDSWLQNMMPGGWPTPSTPSPTRVPPPDYPSHVFRQTSPIPCHLNDYEGYSDMEYGNEDPDSGNESPIGLASLGLE